MMQRLFCCCAGGKAAAARDEAMEARGLVAAPQRKMGAMEVKERLDACKLFKSVGIERYMAQTFEDVPGASTSSSAAASGGSPGISPTAGSSQGKLDSCMISNYLEGFSSAERSNQYTLVVKGPLRIREGEENALTLVLDELEALLLDETDAKRFQLHGIQLDDIDIRFPMTSFVNNLLMSGTVLSVSFVNCVVSPSVLSGGVHLGRSTTLAHISFRSCSLTDAHLASFTRSLQDAPGCPLLAALVSLRLNGTFSEPAVSELLAVLSASAGCLRSLSLPRRHETLTKSHALATESHPHLLFNGKKVRHVL